MNEPTLRERLTVVGKSLAVMHYFSTADLGDLDSPVFSAPDIDARAACFDAVEAFVASLSFDDANGRDYNSVVDEKYGDDPSTKPASLPGQVQEAFENSAPAEIFSLLEVMRNEVLYNAEDAGILEHTFSN